METEKYKAPEHVIKPYPGDTGYALVKGMFNKGMKDIQAQNKKNAKRRKMKTFEEFACPADETSLNESQAFFFEDTVKEVDLSNVPGSSEPTATVKWSLELVQNKSGVEAFNVQVKALHVKWSADEDLGEAGEAEVKTDKINVKVDGSLFNLYCEQVSYDNKTGEAEVRFGRNADAE